MPRFPSFFKLNNILLYIFCSGFPGGSVVKNPPTNTGDSVRSLGREDPLKEEIATHSSILAWEVPLTEEPGGLQSMGITKCQI